jgi:mycothiol system anti-sigma-R factor
MSRCNQVLDLLYEYINAQTLTSEDLAEIRKHLDHCHGCWDRYEFEQRLIERLKGAGGCSCPDTLRTRVRVILELY